jgi:hypothetical protein
MQDTDRYGTIVCQAESVPELTRVASNPPIYIAILKFR